MPGNSSIFTPTFWFPILGGHVEPTILVRGHVFSRSQTPFLGVAVLSPFDLRLGAGATCYCTGLGCPANCQSTTPCYLDNDGETLKILEFWAKSFFQSLRPVLRPEIGCPERRGVSKGKMSGLEASGHGKSWCFVGGCFLLFRREIII